VTTNRITPRPPGRPTDLDLLAAAMLETGGDIQLSCRAAQRARELAGMEKVVAALEAESARLKRTIKLPPGETWPERK
jgi:hypothetical protein